MYEWAATHLIDLLVDSVNSEKAIDVDWLLLSVAKVSQIEETCSPVNASHCLKVCGRVPVQVSRESSRPYQSLSNSTRREALGSQSLSQRLAYPMRFKPTPPALALRRNTILSRTGLRLNLSTRS